MIKLEETDFRPIDSFPLKWRWTDPRWNKLPDHALNSIQPLSETKARELCQHTLTFSNQSGLVESQFENIARIDTSDDSDEIRRWLLARSSDLNRTVVVSWDNKLAALVGWEVFCEYWDDFCYPSSDDVVIFPLSGDWMLFYSHDEYFMFGKLLPAAQPNNSFNRSAG
jgi:hypothetical protein